jgi:hypothetical protein
MGGPWPAHVHEYSDSSFIQARSEVFYRLSGTQAHQARHPRREACGRGHGGVSKVPKQAGEKK